jgi:hypothetical protein
VSSRLSHTCPRGVDYLDGLQVSADFANRALRYAIERKRFGSDTASAVCSGSIVVAIYLFLFVDACCGEREGRYWPTS